MTSGETTVPCYVCGTPTNMQETQLCDPCWNTVSAIEHGSEAAIKEGLKRRNSETSEKGNSVMNDLPVSSSEAKRKWRDDVLKTMEISNTSKTELARSLGVTNGRITAILSGSCNPTLDLMFRTAQALQSGLEVRTAPPRRKIPAKELKVGDKLEVPSVPPCCWEILKKHENLNGALDGTHVEVRVSNPSISETYSQDQTRWIPEEGYPLWRESDQPEECRKSTLLRAAFDILKRESKGMRLAAQYEGAQQTVDCLVWDIVKELDILEDTEPIPFNQMDGTLP